jgi:hypothetical protein
MQSGVTSQARLRDVVMAYCTTAFRNRKATKSLPSPNGVRIDTCSYVIMFSSIRNTDHVRNRTALADLHHG